jgi:hypothetical protein
VSGPPLSRRAVLRSGGAAGLLGAAVLGGCDLDPTSSSSAPPAAAPPDPDQQIVESARAELTSLIGHLAVTQAATENQIFGAGDSLVDLHRAQLAALGGQARPASLRGRVLSHTQLVAHERRAGARFTHWALTCDNGDLARVLASVAAGIATFVQGLTS